MKDLLNALPKMFCHTRETHSALGPALQAAYKLMTPTGGRVSVFQTQLPTIGTGLLQSREDPNQRSSSKVYTPKNFKNQGVMWVFFFFSFFYKSVLWMKLTTCVCDVDRAYSTLVLLQTSTRSWLWIVRVSRSGWTCSF